MTTSTANPPTKRPLVSLLKQGKKRLARRWFVLRNVHAKEGTILVQPRHAITWMRGPLTRVELRAAVSGGPAGATKVSEDLAGSVGR